MRDEDKPFVCYKAGWSIKIVPRGAAGWRAFGLWMAALAVPLAGFLVALPATDDQGVQIALTGAFVTISLVWAVAMVRWMMARSEVVDMDELLELKRKRDDHPSASGRRRP